MTEPTSGDAAGGSGVPRAGSGGALTDAELTELERLVERLKPVAALYCQADNGREPRTKSGSLLVCGYEGIKTCAHAECASCAAVLSILGIRRLLAEVRRLRRVEAARALPEKWSGLADKEHET